MDLRTPLATARGLGAAASGVEHWWQQRLTAVANVPLVIFLLGLALSLVGKEHGEVAARLSHPVVTIGLTLALTNLVLHMRLGMQVIIEDYVLDPGRKIACIIGNNLFTAALWTTGVFSVLKLGLGG